MIVIENSKLFHSEKLRALLTEVWFLPKSDIRQIWKLNQVIKKVLHSLCTLKVWIRKKLKLLNVSYFGSVNFVTNLKSSSVVAHHWNVEATFSSFFTYFWNCVGHFYVAIDLCFSSQVTIRVQVCEWTICPNKYRKVMLWLVKYWVNYEVYQFDTGMIWGRFCIVQRSPSNWV